MHHADNQNPPEAAVEPLRHGLEHARRELLDLGLRNNLLNYRLLKSRGVEAVTTDPDELFSGMLEGRQIRFRAEPSDTVIEPVDDRRTKRPSAPATSLSVDAEDPELERRLLNTHDAARISMEEQGLNTLFLAVGMLEWYESDSSQQPRYAPLILAPVELSRRDATSRFFATYTGEDIGANLSLAAKLSAEFQLTLPEFDVETGSVSSYLAQVQRAIARNKRWAVHPERVVLGQFSFNKFLMYHDLDLTSWPDEIDPLVHPVMQGLLSQEGFTPQPSNYREDQFLDDVVSDDDHPMVVDADSSQTLALLDAVEGRNMVIQGPPGTGKSQTITNLIALAIGQGKKVLFVAEKMAALEVVKRRLDQLELGVACLELHGTKTRKRRVLDDLRDTLGLGEPYLSSDLDNQFRLGANRSWLNEYCRALSAPIGQSGVSAYNALGEVVKARDELPVREWPALSMDGVAEWEATAFHERSSLVNEVEATRRYVGDPRVHPYRGVRRTSLTPVEEEQLRAAMQRALDLLNEVTERNAAIWQLLGQQPKAAPAAIETAIATGERAATVEAQGEIRYANPAWLERVDEIESLLIDGKMATELQGKLTGKITDKAWEADLDSLIDTCKRHRGSIFQLFSWTYWKSRGQIGPYMSGDAPADFDARVDLLADVQRYQRLCAEIEQQGILGTEMFGDHWNGRSSDWARLDQLASSAISLHRDIRKGGLNRYVLEAIDHGADPAELNGLAGKLGTAFASARESISGLRHELAFDQAEHSTVATDLLDWSIDEQYELVSIWQENLGTLSQWVAFRKSLQSCQEHGLQSVAERAWTWNEAGRHLVDLYRYWVSLELLDHAWRLYSILGSTGTDNKELRRAEFSRLDQDQLLWNRARLARAHWEHLPQNGGAGELRILTTEIQKKRRNLPIRKLMRQAGNAVQAVKPVFMMSPLSVANFLPPGSLQFDLVVFDEASQVAPVDAFGAILRGSQAIVVGDDRQLPPTTFFERTMERDDLDEEDRDLVAPGDMQSILNLFLAQNAPQRMLRWHYRSQHESLIAVSNREFYDNRLVVFPSPSRESGNLGLRFNHLPDTVYDRGRSKTNQKEAQAVAAAVMEHAHESGDLTLGVAAFSSSQAEAIRDQLEVLRREDLSVESFFSDDGAEPFFIKSLENVQGDERDVIYISIGYGRDEHGRVTNNFGPVNNDGGERRLNVLITRARKRCEIFTNITDEDISASSASLGVQALRTFLNYARNEEFSAGVSVGGETGSPFEEAVLRRLQGSGYEVHCQVGSAGYFIDLAVVDPERPGRYLLAIECDGASYHSARSSRDRDRLRQQVLEGLGWTFHRIWSTDWFADSDRETTRLIASIDEAKNRVVDPPVVPPSGNYEITRVDPPDEFGSNPELPPYVFAEPVLPPATNGLESYDDETLGDAILEVVDVEGPIPREFVHRRITYATGLKRTGNRIRERLDQIIKRLTERRSVRVRDEFLWPAAMTEPPLRSRVNLEQGDRKPELIAPEELDRIILHVVEGSFTIGSAETARMVILRLGWQRLGHNMNAAIAKRIGALLWSGGLQQQDGKLTVPTTDLVR